MLKSSSLCFYSSNLGTFWLKIDQFWPVYCHSPGIFHHRFGQFIVILQASVTIVLASLLSFSRHLWPSFWPVYCHSPDICDHRFGQFIVILQPSVTIVLASLLSCSSHLWPSFWPVYCHSPGICDHRFGQFIVILQPSVTIPDVDYPSLAL
jgi:hypothetical protein